MPGIPPPLPGAQSPGAKNLRLATALNVFLPGAGLFYLGQRLLGAIVALAFLACFIAVLAIFLVGYIHYLNAALGEDLLKGNTLEEIGAGFHQGWLLSLGAIGVLLYLISAVLFHQAKRKLEAP